MLYFRLSVKAFLAEAPRCGTFLRSDVFYRRSSCFFIILFFFVIYILNNP